MADLDYERGLSDAAKLTELMLSGAIGLDVSDLAAAIINLRQPPSADLRYGLSRTQGNQNG